MTVVIADPRAMHGKLATMEADLSLAVGGTVTQANGTTERASEAVLKNKAKGSKRITVGEDKAYDASDHIAALRRMSVTPHVAQNNSLTKTGKRRRSAIDSHNSPHRLSLSQTCRKMTECIFGWASNMAALKLAGRQLGGSYAVNHQVKKIWPVQ